ncbi:MAG: hypothetical protein Fur0041_09000 [Bacteroidia bacterium]
MNKFSLLILSVFAFASLTFVSCQPDEDPTPADDRDKYVDQWVCNENSSQIGQNSYIIHINKSTTNSGQILIENLYNIGFNYKATADVSGSSFNIPQQTYYSNQLRGSGTMPGNNTINLTYYIDNGTTIDTCVATLTRQ